MGQFPTFVDNYYSREGFGSALGGFPGTSEVVDVLFHPEDLFGSLSPTNPFGALQTLFGSHDYPPPWYGQASLQNPSVQQNGLAWSPLLDADNSANLAEFYEQQQQATPGEYVRTQFELNTPGAPPNNRPASVMYTPTFTDLEYAQLFNVGSVADDGQSITLNVDSDDPHSINAITFNPLGLAGTAGTGLEFEFEFSGVDPGEQVELVIWIQGTGAVPRTALSTAAFGSTLGLVSVPLFVMNGTFGGSDPQKATISLDGFHLGTLIGPFAAILNNNGTAAITPTLGFSLITSTGSDASVTVNNLRQFSDGIS
jgi:hypothetical protein